jgi:uncharacterized lipoprotein YajG
MRKMGVLFVVLLLCGCRAAPQTQPSSAVVAHISVDGVFEGRQISGSYTDSDRMRTILLYIRALRPKHSANAEGVGEEVYITLTYRDGRQKQYLLKAATYWQEDGGGWRTVDTTAAEKLCRLLLQLQGEETATEKSL